MPAGHLALVLHAHLPFVRHPEHEHFLEEDWLFEAITETYIPLLAMMQRLVSDAVPVKLNMSIFCSISQRAKSSAAGINRNFTSSPNSILKCSRKADASLSSNGNAICS